MVFVVIMDLEHTRYMETIRFMQKVEHLQGMKQGSFLLMVVHPQYRMMLLLKFSLMYLQKKPPGPSQMRERG